MTPFNASSRVLPWATRLRTRSTGSTAGLRWRGELLQVAPGHRPGEGPLVELAAFRRGRVPALLQHGDPVGDVHHLRELVRDDHDRMAVLAELPESREQALDLGRAERRGRLVEDERRCAAVEQLEDLDPLARVDRQIRDLVAGAHVEVVLLGVLLDLLLDRPRIEPQAGRRLGAEHDVLGHGEVGHEHEVLVHHPDPPVERVTGRPEVDLLVADVDLPVGARDEAEHDAHQRRLAGAVLAEQGVDLAGLNVEVDVVERDKVPVVLRDRGQPNAPRAGAAGASAREAAVGGVTLARKLYGARPGIHPGPIFATATVTKTCNEGPEQRPSAAPRRAGLQPA